MKYPHHRAITTRYKGFAFRSRLEARWAVFFDHLGIRWDYEPEGYELGNGLRYLPDFWLPDLKLWVEIKPDAPDEVTKEKAFRLLQHGGHPVYITCGMPDRNGVLVYHDTDYEVKILPAFVYFAADTKGVLTFGSTFRSDGNHRCYPLWVHEIPFDPQCAAQGARSASVGEKAIFAARAARFEFGQEGA